MLTLGDIFHGMVVSPLERRRLLNTIGLPVDAPRDTQLSANHCLLIWVFTLFARLKFLDSEQQRFVFSEFCQECADLGSLLAAGRGKALSPMVVFADGRYATWYEHTGWVDLLTGDTVCHPINPLETVAYNLDTLYTRNMAECRRLADRPKDVRHVDIDQSCSDTPDV